MLAALGLPHDRTPKPSHPVPLRHERYDPQRMGLVSRAEYHRFLRAMAPTTEIANPLAPDIERRRRPNRRRVRRRCFGPLRLYNAIAVAQSKFTLDTTAASTTMVLAFDSNVTAGNTIIVATAAEATSGNGTTSNIVTGVADGIVNTLARTETTETIVPTSSDRGHVSIWYKDNISGGASTITVTCDRNIQGFIGILEVSGLATSTSLDKIMTSTSASATAITTGLSGTLSQADEIIVGLFFHWGSTVTITPGQTAVGENEDSSEVAGAVSYQIVSATTSVANTWTTGSAVPYAGHGATFKQAAAAGGVAGPLIGGRLVNNSMLVGGRLVGR